MYKNKSKSGKKNMGKSKPQGMPNRGKSTRTSRGTRRGR
jgi:hypothetical protein